MERLAKKAVEEVESPGNELKKRMSAAEEAHLKAEAELQILRDTLNEKIQDQEKELETVRAELGNVQQSLHHEVEAKKKLEEALEDFQKTKEAFDEAQAENNRMESRIVALTKGLDKEKKNAGVLLIQRKWRERIDKAKLEAIEKHNTEATEKGKEAMENLTKELEQSKATQKEMEDVIAQLQAEIVEFETQLQTLQVKKNCTQSIIVSWLRHRRRPRSFEWL